MIIEKVVHAASRQNGSSPSIQRSPQYVLAACKYELYRLAEREKLNDQASQDDFDAKVDARSADWEIDIHRRLRVEEALANVRGKYRDLLVLFSQSYSWEHIGQLLGMTPESAKTQCYRVLRRIREAQSTKAKAVSPSSGKAD